MSDDKRYTYVIVPKFLGSADERPLWGLVGRSQHVCRIIEPLSDPLSFEAFKSAEIPEGAVLIFHESDRNTLKNKLLDKLPRPVRFFIHFGNTDLNELDYGEIEKLFETRFGMAIDDNIECFPYTGSTKSQFAWSHEIWRIQEKLKSKKPDTSLLNRILNDSWGKAKDFYDLIDLRKTQELWRRASMDIDEWLSINPDDNDECAKTFLSNNFGYEDGALSIIEDHSMTLIGLLNHFKKISIERTNLEIKNGNIITQPNS
jgi:hypothetical protein